MTEREALKLALEAFEHFYSYGYDRVMCEKAIIEIKEALAQPEQGPVAWATQMGEYAHIKWGAKRPEYPMGYEVPLYTAPPQRTWVGLDADEVFELASGRWTLGQMAVLVEAKLKEKNT